MRSFLIRAPSIPPCCASSSAAGSVRNGAPRKPIAAPSSIPSAAWAASRLRQRPKTGSASPPPWPASLRPPIRSEPMPENRTRRHPMDRLRTLLSRLASLPHRNKLDANLDEELRSHIDLATEDNLKRGMSPRQARTEALRSFGGVTQTRETYRQQRGMPMFEQINRDIRFAIRQLRRSPGFTLTTVFTLAIGIGINTAVFSMMDTVVLRPLAVPDLKHVVAIAEEQGRGEYKQVALANYLSWKQQSRSFENLAVRSYASMSLTGAGEAVHIEAANTSGNFFALLRSEPLLGRLYQESESQPGRNNVAVLSYGFWQKHF